MTCEHTLFTVYNEYEKKIVTTDKGSYDRSHIWIRVTNFGSIRYRKDILFTFEDLLVSFGSTISFFLGCSILSFVELIYFITLRMFFYLHNRYTTNTVTEIRRHRIVISLKQQQIKKNLHNHCMANQHSY
ncbi:hypothetical protein C0J52_04231 [Blattella germanica]|nr:hypothetical protein C0J52_04231 [Blattella germanica]